MDTVAKRLADAAHQMVGRFTDTPYPTWDEATDSLKEFWREVARASQDREHGGQMFAREAGPSIGDEFVSVSTGKSMSKPRKAKR